jgi:methylase of polypeptide subunit release factors
MKGSLLYGELLPRGANKALSSQHLNAATARTLFDMGMGTGKIVIQAFLQFRNLELVYGVELSAGRYK